MSNTKSSNQTAVPEAKGALDRFKFEVANELGVPLTDGYNGNLTSKQNGSVGGYMVNMTSLEMEGFSITLLRLDDQMKELLDEEADTPALTVAK